MVHRPSLTVRSSLGWLALLAFACSPPALEVASSLPDASGGSSSMIWPPLATSGPQTGGAASAQNPWIAGFGGESPGAVSGAGGSAEPDSGSTGGSAVRPSEPDIIGEGAGGSGNAAPELPEAEVPQLEPPELWLARYDETETATKRLLIENLGRSIEADECELSIYANGNTSPYRKLELPATEAGSQLQLCTSDLSEPPCVVSLGSSSFNGNDALVLTCLGAVQDSLGRIGEDPGKAWSDGSLRTIDIALAHCPGSADTDPQDPVRLTGAWVQTPFDSTDEAISQLCRPIHDGEGGAASRL